MLTRCPRCRTTFRVTSEQLRLKAGKVRCGHCQGLFNALESLVEEPRIVPVPVAAPTPQIEEPEAPPAETSLPPAEPEAPPPEALPAFAEDDEEEPVDEVAPPLVIRSPRAPAGPEALEAPPLEETEEKEEPELVAAETSDTLPVTLPEPDPDQTEPAPAEETPAESTEAARAAGLMAARELAEAPGYNRWAAGTLAGSPAVGLDGENRKPVAWPFVLVAVLLSLGLLFQVAHYFRTEIALRLPGAIPVYAALGIDIPLPRQADLVSIEDSDLQSDTARRLLVLQATLKNRAPYAQAWPTLELTLTDTHDTVVARRTLSAAEYLPPKADPKAFAGESEIGLRLWLEAKEAGAAGYRLYVFYP